MTITGFARRYTIRTGTYICVYSTLNCGLIVTKKVKWSTQFNFNSINTQFRISHRHKIILYGRRLMDTGAAVLWNNLPNNFKCVSSLHLFKKLLKTFLL